ncbi:hypothetical protein WICPIJ_006369 [Wickerhamomyces pijperi]|uniref:separase n=1 Tax=Wickerhamomyces pijperi TaxID=599730 RepID=A0A9P8TL30_WICPI|nr:hypothetical protein WICPIJ_006369 [Wickerhamomyces pijperi]
MNDDLEYIIANYAHLRLNGSPSKGPVLSTAAINISLDITTSKGKPSAQTSASIHTHSTFSLDTPMKQQLSMLRNNPTEIYDLCIKAINFCLPQISTLKTLNSSYLALAVYSFRQVYRLRLTSKSSEVAKTHQTLIVNLLQLEGRLHTDFSVTLDQIKFAYLNSEATDFDVIDILSAQMNNSKVANLKVLILQVLLRRFQASDFKYSDELQLFFLNPDYINGSVLSDNHKSALTKIVLSLSKFSPSVEFSQCMNIQFLFYLNSFGFKFEDYVKNISQEQFVEKIRSVIQSLKLLGYVPNMLYQLETQNDQRYFVQTIRSLVPRLKTEPRYSSINWDALDPESKASIGLLRLLKLPNVNPALIVEELKSFNYFNDALIQALCDYLTRTLKTSFEDPNLHSIIIAFTSQISKLDTKTLAFFDSLLSCSSRFIQTPEFLNIALLKVGTLLLTAKQLKRSRNVSSLFFNLALKVDGPFYKSTFLENSLKIQKSLYLGLKTDEELRNLSIKFVRACRLCGTHGLDCKDIVRLVLDEELLNLIGTHGILQKLEQVEELFATKQAFGSSTNFNFKSYSEENQAVLFAILAKHSDLNDLSRVYGSLNINSPVGQMLCGIFYNDMPIIKSTQRAVGSAKPFDFLIKLFYYLTVEIKSKSTTNLLKIVQMYVSNWVSRNKGSVAAFELEFLSKLFSYLRFVNFRKTALMVLKELEGYRGLALSSKFQSWFLSHRLDVGISLRAVDEGDVAELEKALMAAPSIPFTDIDHFLNFLSLNLLKLRYHLMNYNVDKLVECSRVMNHVIQASNGALDLKNKNGHSKTVFIRIATLVMNLYFYRCKALALFGDQKEIISSLLKCIGISRLVIHLDSGNLEALRLLSSSYTNLIQKLIQLGLSKDVEFFISEFQRFSKTIFKYRMLYTQNMFFICYCSHILGKESQMLEYKGLSDTNYKTLNHMISSTSDLFIDNHKLQFFKLLSDVYCSSEKSEELVLAKSKMSAFLDNYQKEHHDVAKIWRLNYEIQYDCTRLLDLHALNGNPYLKSTFDILNSKKLLFQAQSALSSDPVFSTLEDSALSIPAANNLDLLDIPVPGSAKARNSTNIKKSVTLLKESRLLVLGLLDKLRYLANYQISDIYKVLSLDLLTLSGISDDYYYQNIDECFKLNDHSKSQPLINEKLMSQLIRNSKETETIGPIFNLPDGTITGLLDDKDQDIISLLPENWQVISIDVCSFNGDLVILKFSKDSSKPNMIRLPVNRHTSRVYGEETFTLKDALVELNGIIARSDATMTAARTSSITNAEDRKKWHLERSQLDEELKLLLDKIELCWLGGFKGIFDQRKFTVEQIQDFRVKFLNIINANVPSRNPKHQNGGTTKMVEIDDFVIELFLRLGNPSDLASVNILEDLIYFFLDILLFHGEENAYDEIDMDSIYVQVEMLLDEQQTSFPNVSENKHTVLIIGKECISIPWESLPCLRSCSVSRVPSLSLLVKLLQQHQGLSISRTDGTFLLNPSGDLVKTQDRFEKILETFGASRNWRGMTNKKPTEDEVVDLITNSNLHIYVGHGGGESYIRSSTLKKLESIAPTLLLGCSSVQLTDNNLLEPTGTAYSYLIGGCPLVVGNLWDVTDKDIDMFTLSVFDKWGLSRSIFDSENSVDICQAVQLSRDNCKLKYMNGAAPVVYGLPFKIVN